VALTLKQNRFVAEYLVDLNATQAAIGAGYTEKGPKSFRGRQASLTYPTGTWKTPGTCNGCVLTPFQNSGDIVYGVQMETDYQDSKFSS
jgi:hypothetical protein